MAKFSVLSLIIATVVCFPSESANADLRRPIADIHDTLLGLFSPIDQYGNDRPINHLGDKPFTGDCDDYYAAAFNQLYRHGYDPHARILRIKGTKLRHVVACVEEGGKMLCLDHNRVRPSGGRELAQWYELVDVRYPQ